MDIRPENVFLMKDGTVKLGNFSHFNKLNLNNKNLLNKSKPCRASYISPERYMTKQESPKEDIWQIGCMMHEIILGEKTFDGDSVEEIE